MDTYTTEQAAARLGVKRETLYAYVSRGRLPSRRGPDGRSTFAREDVERLAAHRAGSRRAPVDLTVTSSITLVRDGRLYHRGHDAVVLCLAHPFESVAELLWTGNLLPRSPWPPTALRPATEPPGGPLARLPGIAAAVPGDRDLVTARSLMAAFLDGLPELGTATGPGFAARLWARLDTARPAPKLLHALDLALSLSADHGLIPSTLAARVVASGGGNLPAAVTAALGPALAAVTSPRMTAVRELLSGGDATLDPLHPDRYPAGDPRTPPLLEALREASPERMRPLDAALARLPSPPDADVGLVALETVAGLPPGSAELVAVVARAAGWIAHALEEYRSPTAFRARMVYTGPEPEAPPARHRLLHAVQRYLGQT